MKFIGTGNGFYTSYRPFFAKCGHIDFFFLYAYYIYTHFKKKIPYLIAGRWCEAMFFLSFFAVKEKLKIFVP